MRGLWAAVVVVVAIVMLIIVVITYIQNRQVVLPGKVEEGWDLLPGSTESQKDC